MEESSVSRWKGVARQITPKRVLLLGGSGVVLAVIIALTSFVWPRTVRFAYSHPNCFANPMVLPDLMGFKSSTSYQITPSSVVRVAGYPIFAGSSCVSPTKLPRAGVAETLSIEAVGTGLLTQSIRVVPIQPPSVTAPASLDQPIATGKSIAFTLNEPDQVFSYALKANALTVACNTIGRDITCDPSKLNLLQATKYPITLTRIFRGTEAGVVLNGNLTTVDPVSVASSSIAVGSMVYDVPNGLTLTLNRAASGVGNVTLKTAAEAFLPITTTLSSTQLTVAFTQPLPRSSSLVLSVGTLMAADGGHLDTPYALTFNVSGGPKVTHVNIGSYKVATTAAIVLSLDTKLAPGQVLGTFVHLQIGSTPIAASITGQGNSITITPSVALPRCTAFTLSVTDGLKNSAGISGGSAWSFGARTICQTVYSIGTSVQGRAILAYSFGTGPSKIVYFGDMHGNEKSAKYTLDDWVNNLEANPTKIPANRTIIVIPTMNPDGFAANTRRNADNVDLNRNFPANDWAPSVVEPDQKTYPAGGGTAPLSEPESAAMAAFIQSVHPRLILSYHATGGIVLPNEAADSVALAHLYDAKSNVGYLAGNQSVSFFDYTATGAFEGWTYDKLGIATLVIELRTETSDEYSGHQNAMWAMAQLP